MKSQSKSIMDYLQTQVTAEQEIMSAAVTRISYMSNVRQHIETLTTKVDETSKQLAKTQTMMQQQESQATNQIGKLSRELQQQRSMASQFRAYQNEQEFIKKQMKEQAIKQNATAKQLRTDNLALKMRKRSEEADVALVAENKALKRQVQDLNERLTA